MHCVLVVIIVELIKVYFKTWLENQFDDWKEEVESVSGINNIVAVLRKWGAQHGEYANLAKPVLKFLMQGHPYVITDFQNPDPQTAEEFVQGLSWNDGYLEYLPERNFTQEFWQGVAQGSVCYHGTTEDNWEDIQRDKRIGCRDTTRGLRNTGVGCAVFTSFSWDQTVYYYEVRLQINLGAMKADGYMPDVSQEPDIEEGEALNSIAWAVGIEDFHWDTENDPDTLIIYGNIPIKYVQRIN